MNSGHRWGTAGGFHREEIVLVDILLKKFCQKKRVSVDMPSINQNPLYC
jgi:hypothetical protein